MKTNTKTPQDERAVSASELAQMGRCERLVLFEHLNGNRRCARHQRDRARGLRAHEKFYKEGLASVSATARREGRCLIATCVFGEAWQTQTLRRFRDDALRPKRWGRLLIRFYYWTAPGICEVLRRWPVLQRPVRSGLEVIARRLHAQAGKNRGTMWPR